MIESSKRWPDYIEQNVSHPTSTVKELCYKSPINSLSHNLEFWPLFLFILIVEAVKGKVEVVRLVGRRRCPSGYAWKASFDL